MKTRYGLTLIFIAHDLAVVKNVSDRIVVMYLGKLCEVAGPDALYTRPAHPYTAALLSAIPVPDPAATMKTPASLQGELPSPLAPPSGCRFRTRCPRAEDRCAREEPQLRPVLAGSEHYVACHFPLVEAAEVLTGTPTLRASGDAPTSVTTNGAERPAVVASEGGWRSSLAAAWRETSVAMKVAVIAALIPFLLHLSST